MNATVQICIKSVYGRDTIYPVCQVAKGMAALAGTKTLTEQSIRIIIGMGFKVQYVDAYAMKFAA